jgi:hypothetical protein
MKNIPNGQKTLQHFPFQSPLKFYPNWDFWFENKPSGNPAHEEKSFLSTYIPLE